MHILCHQVHRSRLQNPFAHLLIGGDNGITFPLTRPQRIFPPPPFCINWEQLGTVARIHSSRIVTHHQRASTGTIMVICSAPVVSATDNSAIREPVAHDTSSEDRMIYWKLDQRP
jgi:hypothetical protein